MKQPCNSRSSASSDEGLQSTSALREVSHCIKNPCQRQWINDGLTKTCSSSCSICTLMKPLKWLNLLEESELWVWSWLRQRFLFRHFGLWGKGGSWYSPSEAIAWFRLKHGITVHTVLLCPCWSTLALSCTDLHCFSRGRWASTKNQCDGVLKWAEF